MNHSRTIPVVNIAGPGSQPEEEDFNFLPIPAGINLPLTPVLPEQALPAELRVARHILTTLIRDMDNPVATLPFPLSYKLNATEQQNSGLLDQLLGEGEISARVLLPDGKSLSSFICSKSISIALHIASSGKSLFSVPNGSSNSSANASSAINV